MRGLSFSAAKTGMNTATPISVVAALACVDVVHDRRQARPEAARRRVEAKQCRQLARNDVNRNAGQKSHGDRN